MKKISFVILFLTFLFSSLLLASCGGAKQTETSFQFAGEIQKIIVVGKGGNRTLGTHIVDAKNEINIIKEAMQNASISSKNHTAEGALFEIEVMVATDNSTSEIFDNKLIAVSSTSPAFSQIVCRARISTAKQCGRVIQKGEIRNNWDDNTVKKVSVVVPDNPGGYDAGGDSGGPVYRPNTTGNTLTGVHVGSNSSYGFFTDIMDGLNHYNASLYTSNSVIKIAN